MRAVEIGAVEDLARLARELHAVQDERSQLQLVIDLAVRLIAGCDHAGVSVLRNRKIFTPAASDDVGLRGDALQYELGEGPCLDSVRSRETVISQDLGRETRWPSWTQRVEADLGVQAIMSLWLSTDARSYGALNLYADRIEAFEPVDHAVAQTLSTLISIALASQREIRERGIAITNRTVIGQAKGILMERLDIDADQAFAYLRQISQRENRKLIVVAEEMVKTRLVPD